MKIIFTILFTIILTGQIFSQNSAKTRLLEYYDNTEKLDPIEGLWSLNVIRTLYYYDEIITQETEEVRSEWGIKRHDKLSFKVIDIGEKSKTDKGSFEAYFESSAIDGFYTYKANFHNPNWSIKTNAELENQFLLEYGYFVDEVYMRDVFKQQYKPGLRLHWEFLWTKKYPRIRKSSLNESAESEWKGNGSGFFISQNGFMATNYHVVSEAKYIEVEFVQSGVKTIHQASIVKSDKQNDLAILKIAESNFRLASSIPCNFETKIVDVGSEVFALGYPMALTVMGTEIKFTDGKISSKTGFQGDIATYQTTTPIQPGNSGGPLFDYNGNLIGINSAILRPDVADNVSYSIKSSYLKALIDVLDYKVILPRNTNLTKISLTDKIKQFSDFVVLIKVK